MGLLNLVGEIAGAVTAVEVAEKADPNAGIIAKGLAAFAGIKGAEKIEEMVENKDADPETDKEA